MAQGVTRHLAHAHPKHRSSKPSGAPQSPRLLHSLSPRPALWSPEGAAALAARAAERPRAALAGPADPRSAAAHSPNTAEPSRGADGHALPSMDMGSRMPNCLRTAMNSSTTTAMAHSSMPWMPMATRAAQGRGVPLARACLGRRPGRCSPPGLLGRPRLTSPGRRGCGCRRGPGPEEGGCGGELGRPGGWTPRGSRARAQLSESAGKLRGAEAAAAAARSAARAAGAGQRRLHGPRGRRASFAPSPAPGTRGHGGAAAAAGVPGAPGRPSLHRGSQRAHWPRRGDHPGRRPLRPPPSRPREHGKGRREVAPPRTAQPSYGAWRTATTPQPCPRRPSGRRFHPTACAGGG